MMCSRRALTHTFVIGVLTVFLVLLAPAVAIAEDEISISAAVPQSVSVGDLVTVTVTVSSAGEPIEGAIVSLSYRASFAGEIGPLELDREMTSSSGVAVLSYEQRASDNGEMSIEYLGPEELDVAPVVFSIEVQPEPEQQYRSEAGISIWWLNGWLVIVVITGLWGLIVYSAFQLVVAAREEEGATVLIPADLKPDDGSTWIAVSLAVVTVVTAVGMVIVFLRNPLTHSNIESPERYDRTPIVHVDDEVPYLGPGLAETEISDTGEPVLDGETLYFQFGCGGCHGLVGEGGAVGEELAGEVGSSGGFVEDVREGPKGMPGYPTEILTDGQLAEIHTFLREDSE